MNRLRVVLVSLLALVASACGDGGVQSPDFTPVLQSIRVVTADDSTAPVTLTLPAGRTAQVMAMGRFSNPPGSATPTTERVLSGVSFAVANTAIGVIEDAGMVRAVSIGTTTISASADGVSSTASGEDATLTVIAAALDSIQITPANASIGVGDTQVFGASGTFSDGSTGPVPGTVTWLSSAPAVATVTSPGATTTATAVTEGTSTITASALDSVGNTVTANATLTVTPFQPILQSITITPDPATAPIGRMITFTATGTFSTAPGAGSPTTIGPVTGVTWSVADVNIATIDSTRGIATGRRIGSTTVIATRGSISDTAVINVTAPVLDSLAIVPANATIPLGTTQVFRAVGTFSDGNTSPLIVGWASSNPGVATVAPGIGAMTTATSVATGGPITITATSSRVDDNGFPFVATATLTVTNATLTGLVRVDPSIARITINRAQEFVAIGSFSNGVEQPIDDSQVNWTSSITAVATIDGNGLATGVSEGQVDIRATLVAGAGASGTATARLTVTGAVCTTPLLVSEGAVVREDVSGLCLLCDVLNEGAIVNANPLDFGTIAVPVGLVSGAAGVTVTAVNNPNYAVPFAGGSNAGFIVAKPEGTLLVAELLSQLTLRTLLGNVVQEQTSGLIPLRVELLGLDVASGNFDAALVSFDSSVPYDAIQLSVNSGVASALTDLQVFAACGTSDVPPPAAALVGIARIAPVQSVLTVGASDNLIAIGVFENGVEAPLSDADITWTSNLPAIATVDANGLATGVAAGRATITAGLRTGVVASGTPAQRSAIATVDVIGNPCTTALTAGTGATITDATGGLLCLLCNVEDRANIIDDAPLTFGSINVPVGLLGGSVSVTVRTALSAPLIPGGNPTGFIIGRPTGQVLLAEALSQVQVSTLRNGVVQETGGGGIPLRLDLLGIEVLDTATNLGLASFTPTQSFDAIRLTFNSGLAASNLLNAAPNLRVFQACSLVTPPLIAP